MQSTEIQDSYQELGGIYPENKGRKTAAPTTPMLLWAMKGISLVFMKINNLDVVQITNHSDVQLEIIKLSGAAEAYQDLLELLNSRKKMRET